MLATSISDDTSNGENSSSAVMRSAPANGLLTTIMPRFAQLLIIWSVTWTIHSRSNVKNATVREQIVTLVVKRFARDSKFIFIGFAFISARTDYERNHKRTDCVISRNELSVESSESRISPTITVKLLWEMYKSGRTLDDGPIYRTQSKAYIYISISTKSLRCVYAMKRDDCNEITFRIEFVPRFIEWNDKFYCVEFNCGNRSVSRTIRMFK